MIVAVLTQKGGAGKTTLALHLAGEWARSGASVLLVDADPQASAQDWAEQRARAGRRRLFGMVGLARETLHREVPDLARGVTHVVIDGPPRTTALVRSALLAAERVLVPVQPSGFDVWASQAMLDLVAEARVYRPELKAHFVVNRRVVRTRIAREVQRAIASLGVPALEASLAQRVIYAEAAGSGLLAREIDRASPAVREVAALAAEVLRGRP
ncbi:ParA family partition ATPase [Nitrospirillum sp. BR 11752]|uniref:Plasmid segregation oscillating ATPase ParF n=1 Tax=Nitrospirillum amazonense TaxID=28077 RepID=A0A560FPA7_9PROT|nr:ParA family partition ATPase [Nitrospirillum amazonense]MEE3624110.1 ParA family partition ATPase [Nitrospirillum sp. BR 11752]TWB23454.1 plasmid segregation oscillating ATPase ParF [Nitrospirillum amazonense]